jgi:hypothetical protein
MYFAVVMHQYGNSPILIFRQPILKDRYFAVTDILCHFTKFKDDIMTVYFETFEFNSIHLFLNTENIK